MHARAEQALDLAAIDTRRALLACEGRCACPRPHLFAGVSAPAGAKPAQGTALLYRCVQCGHVRVWGLLAPRAEWTEPDLWRSGRYCECSQRKINGKCPTCAPLDAPRAADERPYRRGSPGQLAAAQARRGRRTQHLAGWRNSHRAAGQCIGCSDQAEPGLLRCTYHLEYLRRYHRERRAAWRRDGLCPQCGGEPAKGLGMCRKHLDVQAASHRAMVLRHVATGLCTHCSAPAREGFKSCARHGWRGRRAA